MQPDHWLHHSEIDLATLAQFTRPTEVTKIVEAIRRDRPNIGEFVDWLVDRLIADGVLVEATLAEKLISLFRADDLRQFLAALDRPTNGSKMELAYRLLAADYKGMQARTESTCLIKCAPATLEAIKAHQERAASDKMQAKRKGFQYLLEGNARDAVGEFRNYAQRYYSWDTALYGSWNPELSDALDVTIRVTAYDHLAEKPAFAEAMDDRRFSTLRAALCMSEIWSDERASNWIPDTMIDSAGTVWAMLKQLRTFLQYEEVKAEHRKVPDAQVKVVFARGDCDSCELCRALRDKAFLIDDLPQLPLPGCTSRTGCQAELQPLYFEDTQEQLARILAEAEEMVGQVYEDEADANTKTTQQREQDIVETPARHPDPLNSLKQLKEMRDQEFITQDEYDEVKRRILDRM